MRVPSISKFWYIIALVVVLIISLVSAFGVGPAAVHPLVVLDIISNHTIGTEQVYDWPNLTAAIIWETRVPRVITGLFTGAVLAVSGAVLQVVVRNPLADPYTLGLSSGASTGAAFVVLVLGTTWLGVMTLPVFAFFGALVATLATLLFAGRRPSPAKLILSGLAVGYGFTAITNMLVFSADNPETARSVLFWMLGSLARASWQDAMICALAALFVCLVVAYFGPALDALGGGDEAAQAVGINPNAVRIGLLIVVSIGVGIVVSASGGIGFVGLVVPHLVRGLLGRAQRMVTLGCVLLGSAFLVAADSIARVALSPVELPIGVITGSVGAPFLLMLLHKSKTPL
ncbi:iron ABC transporter permease [Stomatohabitans albus]|uniref:FecCD family ABC transporter permease n=1 Tax=Stomatohabitans albus TaxID=3110766 RepID=UPI00300C3414